MDFDSHYPGDTTHIIFSNDWYLLGVLNSTPAFEYFRGTCAALGDEENAGRLRFFGVHMEPPLPDASTADREAVAKLAPEAQRLQTQSRARVEQFVRDLVTSSDGQGRGIRNPTGTLEDLEET